MTQPELDPRLNILQNLENSPVRDSVDPKDVLRATESIPQQLRRGWEKGHEVEIPSRYKYSQSLVFAGMGASIYAGEMIKSLFENSRVPVPTALVEDYDLPSAVNSNSLVIATSYSGETAETLSAVKGARKRGSSLIIITTGGQLEKVATENRIPAYVFPKDAPAPRFGSAETITATLAVLDKAGIVPMTSDVVEETIERVGEQTNDIKQKAMELAAKLHGKSPVIMAAGHLRGNSEAMRNMFEETSGMVARREDMPNAFHHMFEGQSPKMPLEYLLIDSPHYSDVIREKIQAAKDVLDSSTIITMDGKNTLEEVLKLFYLGAFATYYSAILNRKEPSTNPFVDKFKMPRLPQS